LWWQLVRGSCAVGAAADTDVTAALLRTAWGRLLLVLVGVVAVAAEVQVGRRPARLNFRERFTAAHMSRTLATIARALGALGCVARSVVFVLAGFFILKAAVLSNSKQTKGLDAVFRLVASSAYRSWLPGLLASGLLCYGLYCPLEARYCDLTPGGEAPPGSSYRRRGQLRLRLRLSALPAAWGLAGTAAERRTRVSAGSG
jgi:hypothetical protein